MSTPSSSLGTSGIMDSATQSADQAIRESQRLARNAIDSLASKVEDVQAAADRAVEGLADDASHLTRRGSEALHQASRQIRGQARQARESARGYIEHDPLKSVLIAMAAGAGLMALGCLIARGSNDRR